MDVAEWTNVGAFLALIEYAEGTARNGRDPYRTCYSYAHTVRDYRDHPSVTGEWLGEPLDSLGPRYVGQKSTAAGRFQIIKPTWLRAKAVLGLPDFSPTSQDRAALWLIQQQGALDDVCVGRIEAACRKCARVWASFPASTAGQPTRKLDQLLARYTAVGGALVPSNRTA